MVQNTATFLNEEWRQSKYQKYTRYLQEILRLCMVIVRLNEPYISS